MKQLDAHNASLHVRVQISFLRLSRKLKGILGGGGGEKIKPWGISCTSKLKTPVFSYYRKWDIDSPALSLEQASPHFPTCLKITEVSSKYNIFRASIPKY